MIHPFVPGGNPREPESHLKELFFCKGEGCGLHLYVTSKKQRELELCYGCMKRYGHTKQKK